MKRAHVTLRSAAPYSMSRQHMTPREEKESHDDYERRTWREKAHYDPKTREVFIPPMALKKALASGASFLSIPISGKGKATYTKHFQAGQMILEPVMLGISVDDLDGEWFMCDAQGKKGSSGGSRVPRCFPVVREWSSSLIWEIWDDTITAEIFERVLVEAGKFIGIGRFRPQNGGFYGRFSVEACQVEKLADVA